MPIKYHKISQIFLSSCKKKMKIDKVHVYFLLVQYPKIPYYKTFNKYVVNRR